MSRPEIMVFAYSEVGYRCLKALIEDGANVKHVISYRDKPGENIWFNSVADLAEENDLDLTLDVDWSDGDSVKRLRSMKPKIIFSFYYRDIIPEKLLKTAKLGAFNMHGSLLPRYRGRACVNWAVLNGETETGATLHRMTREPDRGDIVDQEVVKIGEKDTAKDVMDKVADSAAQILIRSLPSIEGGKVEGVKQDETLSTYFGGRTPKDGAINWNKSTKKIYDLIRAVTDPYPGAFTFFEGKKLFIWWSDIIEGKSLGKPGEVLSLDPCIIATGRGNLRLAKVQFQGERVKDGSEFAREHLRIGARFEEPVRDR